ncbi:hypothetical protein D6829_01850 [Candidatus Pacearchaeota archaeon]|nr:MAG: hypothetical protein D6829_01850 [Candidatus Pacearchaeota archaeon]
MRKVIVERMRKIKQATPTIEKKLKVKIVFKKDSINLKGPEPEEFLAEQIVRAVDFGFKINEAMLLTNPDFILEFIDIKDFTPRKNLKDVRARLIGKKGKAKKTIENLTGANIVIKGNSVGVIVGSEHLNYVTQAIESLIHGAKHGNVFAYLEHQNARQKKFDRDDLGLKS